MVKDAESIRLGNSGNGGNAMKRQHNGKVEKAADILRSLLAEKKWQHRINLHQVFLFWNEVVGRDIAAHAEPEVIRGSVLWIKVSDSVWMQQLHLQKMLLLEKINDRLGADNLSDLRFHLDVRSGTPAEDPKRRRRQKKKVPTLPQELENMIIQLESQDTQEALRRLWRKVKEEEP